MPLVLPATSVTGVRPSAPLPARGLLRGGSIVAGGMAVEVASQLARTLILARLLGAGEFGLVVSINTLVAVVELVGFIGVDRYIVYAPEGGSQAALDAGHTIAALRAVISAAIVLALAIPTAWLIGERANAGSFCWVAAVPLMRGAAHLGVVQMQRSGRFWPASASDGGGAALGAVAAGVAAWLSPTHTAVLWGLGVQTGAALVLTHWFANATPFRMSLDPRHIRDALRYGLPLMANGVAITVASQLDRIVVGAWLGVAKLGLYGLCMTLVLQPIAQVLRLSTTALQPPLSAAWHADPEGEFLRLARNFAGSVSLLATIGAAGAACLGAPLVTKLFGHTYAPSDAFFAFTAGALLLRLGRGGLNVLALSIGRTSDLMLSNLAGMSALPIMIIAMMLHPGIEAAAFGAMAGELLAYGAGHVRLRRHCAAACDAFLKRFLVAMPVPVLLAGWIQATHPEWLARVGVIACVLFGAAPVALREWRTARRVDPAVCPTA